MDQQRLIDNAVDAEISLMLKRSAAAARIY
jgi:hypothetical protein